MKTVCCLLSLLWAGIAHSSQIPASIFPAGVGVNIHFVTGHQKDLDLIAAAGFKFIRMDFGWESIEKTKGSYDWAGYDELLGNLEKRGLKAVFILDYSNPLYEEMVSSVNPLNQQPHRTLASPQHPESIAAYARWAAAATKHFHGRPIIWEIWNEPNIQFWNPKPDVHQYTDVALAACRAIRQTEPDATLVGPASSEFPWEFLTTFLQSGVLEYLDAVSVHPYRQYSRPPETASADYDKLRQLIDRFSPTSKKGQIPILSGEWGYASHTKGVSLDTQAAFAARQQLANLLHGVPLSIWYDWKNDGTNPEEREDNFGTVLPDLEPKPAYHAIQTLTRELAGYRIDRRFGSESEKDYLLLCEKPGDAPKLAAWTIGEAHQVSLAIESGKPLTLTAIKGDGTNFHPVIEGDQLRLELSATPQYVPIRGFSIRPRKNDTPPSQTPRR